MARILDQEMATQVAVVLSQLKFLANNDLLELPEQITDEITIEVMAARRIARLSMRDRFYIDVTSENGVAALIGAGRVPLPDELLDIYHPIVKRTTSRRRAAKGGRSDERTQELARNVLAHLDRAKDDQPIEDYRIVPFETASCWLKPLRLMTQESNWCVPTSMAILSPAMSAGTERTPDYYAEKWVQRDGVAFDMETMGMVFREVCKKEKLLFWERKAIDFEGICKLGKPTILMLVGDAHATVLIGATDCAAIDGSRYKVNGYVYIDPANGSKQWRYCGPQGAPCNRLVKPV
jgi:hypothetical protein